MSNIGPMFVTVLASIIGLAALAVAVSQRANTSQVIQSSGNALSSIIAAATAPVTGGGSNNFGTNALGGLFGQTLG